MTLAHEIPASAPLPPFDREWRRVLEQLDKLIRRERIAGGGEITAISLHESRTRSMTFASFSDIDNPLWLDDAEEVVLWADDVAVKQPLRISALFMKAWAYEATLTALTADLDLDVEVFLDDALLQFDADLMPFIARRMSAEELRKAIADGKELAIADDAEAEEFGEHCRGVGRELRKTQL